MCVCVYIYVCVYSTTYFFPYLIIVWGFPGDTMVKNLPATCRRYKRHKLDPQVRKIPLRGAWQPTPVFAWRIPWTEEPSGLQSMGSQRIRHD